MRPPWLFLDQLSSKVGLKSRYSCKALAISESDHSGNAGLFFSLLYLHLILFWYFKIENHYEKMLFLPESVSFGYRQQLTPLEGRKTPVGYFLFVRGLFLIWLLIVRCV